MAGEKIRKHPQALCEECPLYSKPCAPSLIPTSPVAAVVARSPGWKEAQTGKPFTGLSGEVLNHLLKQQGIDREEVLLTNVVLCAPDDGPIPSAAIKACAPRLHEELHGVPLVIAAGSEAVNLLLGRGAIDRYRGFRIDRENATYVATNNPALVLRDDSTFPNLVKDFKRAFNPIPEPTLPIVEVIENVDEARTFLQFLRKHKYVAADLETRGGLSHTATIVSAQFSVDGNTAIVLGERSGLWDDRDFVSSEVRPLLESGSNFIWHNGKFDVKILRHGYGINARVDEDTMLMSYACDERTGQTDKQHGGYHKLEYLLSEEFGWPNYEPQSVKKFKTTGIVTNYDELYKYAGWDAAGTYQLFELLSNRLKEEGIA